MTENCVWTDSLIELQLWTRLSAFARFVHDHQIVLKCTGKALGFADLNTLTAAPKPSVTGTGTASKADSRAKM